LTPSCDPTGLVSAPSNRPTVQRQTTPRYNSSTRPSNPAYKEPENQSSAPSNINSLFETIRGSFHNTSHRYCSVDTNTSEVPQLDNITSKPQDCKSTTVALSSCGQLSHTRKPVQNQLAQAAKLRPRQPSDPCWLCRLQRPETYHHHHSYGEWQYQQGVHILCTSPRLPVHILLV
jgi:uncharacterized ParB-like nuclease family protein